MEYGRHSGAKFSHGEARSRKYREKEKIDVISWSGGWQRESHLGPINIWPEYSNQTVTNLLPDKCAIQMLIYEDLRHPLWPSLNVPLVIQRTVANDNDVQVFVDQNGDIFQADFFFGDIDNPEHPSKTAHKNRKLDLSPALLGRE